MPFIRRLGYFLLGLSIGLIFLAIFLRKKSDETGTEFCYLPNCRVLKELRSKPYILADKELESRLDSVAINEFLKDGDIDFGQSNPRATPCGTYLIEGDRGSLELSNCPDTVKITAFNE